MKHWLTIFICVLAAPLFAQQPESEAHFHAVDIYINSGNAPLAAYQLEFTATNIVAKIAGIEGGQHPAFRNAPFYDPKAMQQERVIIGAFSTESAENLPKGKTRVATIHLETFGNTQPIFQWKLQTAADSAGNKIPVTITCEEKKTQ